MEHSQSDTLVVETAPVGAEAISTPHQTLFTCHVCNAVTIDRHSLHLHMQQHGVTAETCDICGQSYEDALDFDRVLGHRKVHLLNETTSYNNPESHSENHQLASSDLTAVGMMTNDGDSDRLVMTNEAGEIMILKGDANQLQEACSMEAEQYPQQLAEGNEFLTAVPLESQVILEEGHIDGSATNATDSADSDAISSEEPGALPTARMITVQDANGQIYNIQLDENQYLSSLLGGGDVGLDLSAANFMVGEGGDAHMQYVVLDSQL